MSNKLGYESIFKMCGSSDIIFTVKVCTDYESELITIETEDCMGEAKQAITMPAYEMDEFIQLLQMAVTHIAEK